jgi:DNA-binding NtrC family response regulator
VRWPTSWTRDEDVEPEPTREANRGLARTRLLVVDDDPALLRAFVRSFRRLFDIRTCLSGEAALQELAAGEVDVLVTDYSMPGMSGIELLQRVMERHPSAGRLMLTAYADAPDVLDLERRGLASAVLMKPWNRGEVEAAVSRALESLSARRPAPEPARG